MGRLDGGEDCCLVPGTPAISMYIYKHVSVALAEIVEKLNTMVISVSLPQLSITLSSASMKAMKAAVQRLKLELVLGKQFKSLSPSSSLEAFKWHVDQDSSENEVARYNEAVKWLQKYVCPEGVTAVLKHRDKWLAW